MKKFVRVGYKGHYEMAVDPKDVSAIVVNSEHTKKHIGAYISATIFFNISKDIHKNLDDHTIILKIDDDVTVDNCYDKILSAVDNILNNNRYVSFMIIHSNPDTTVFINTDEVIKVLKIYDEKYEIFFSRADISLTISKTKIDIIAQIINHS